MSLTSSEAPTTSRPTVNVPLTTIFTPAAWCTDMLYTSRLGEDNVYWRANDGPGKGSARDCYGYFLDLTPNWPTITPALTPGVCPLGWEAVHQEQEGVNEPVTSWCCRSGMTHEPSERGCKTIVTIPTTVALNPSTNVSVTTAFTAIDWGIKVTWASSDLDLFTPASAPILARMPTAASQTSDNTREQSVTSSRTSALKSAQTTSKSLTAAGSQKQDSHSGKAVNTSTGLSTGAKAGIAVGAAAVLILFLVCVFLLFLRRHRAKRIAQEVIEKRTSAPRTPRFAPWELDGAQRYEVYGTSSPVEVDAQASKAELDSGWRGWELRRSERASVPRAELSSD